MLDKAPNARVTAFLGKFGAALAAGDVDAAVALFGAESYWRDLVAFTWNIKTMEGRDQVRDMLTHCLSQAKPRDWRIAEGEVASEADGVLESWISFETEIARGYGLIRIKDGLVWTLLTTMAELKGHEEKAGFTRVLGARHGVNPGAKTWKELRDEEFEKLGYDTQPYVLIVGGGQGAIGLGARLRQLGVPTIIVEKNERAGDSWRKRYKSLCLHDPVWYDHLPYIDFPKNWPVFSPKDKIGDWLEMYAKVMELNYWTKTTVKKATFDPKKKEWTVVVDRDGKKVSLRPKQLVFATGMSSKPVMPRFKGMETFKGDQHHSSSHPGPRRLQGQKGRRHWLEQFGARHLRGAVRSGRRRHHGAAVEHAYRALEYVDGYRARRSLFRARSPRRHDDGQGGPYLRLVAVRRPGLAAEAGLRQDLRSRRRFL